jgi:hypothetical protein
MVRVACLPTLIGIASLSLASASGAAPVRANPPATATAAIMRPLTLQKQADMDFAWLGVTTGGTATIDPLTGALSLTGGLVRVGGTPSPARYAGAASKQTVVNIRVPNQPVLIQRVGGTETLSVSDFTLDGQDKRSLAQAQSFTFAVGARLTVPAGTVEGVYTGEIEVTIQYP